MNGGLRTICMPKQRVALIGTSLFIIKELTSLCYGLGLDLVHQDFPFQSIREKSFKRESRGWQTLDFAVSFCHLASQVTKSSSADALDSRRRVRIGNAPLVTKAAAAAERSIHGPEAVGPAARPMPLGPPVLGSDPLGWASGLDISLSGQITPPKHTSASVWF